MFGLAEMTLLKYRFQATFTVRSWRDNSVKYNGEFEGQFYINPEKGFFLGLANDVYGKSFLFGRWDTDRKYFLFYKVYEGGKGYHYYLYNFDYVNVADEGIRDTWTGTFCGSDFDDPTHGDATITSVETKSADKEEMLETFSSHIYKFTEPTLFDYLGIKRLSIVTKILKRAEICCNLKDFPENRDLTMEEVKVYCEAIIEQLMKQTEHLITLRQLRQ